MQIVRQISGKQVQLGGETHSGWLPDGVSQPSTNAVRNAILDLKIIDDGYGYLLVCESRNTLDSWDTWHESVEDAEHQATFSLGIDKSEWQ